MDTEFSRFLDKIQANQYNDELHYRANQALNNFPCPSVVTNREQFEDCITRLADQVYGYILNGPPGMPLQPELGRQMAYEALKDLYGPHGMRKAMIMAHTALEGGMTRVLTDIAKQIVRDRAKKSITAAVNLFLGSLSPTQTEQVAQEYLARFGHLLPSELTEKNGVMLGIKIKEVLIEHPALMQRMRHTMQARGT